VKAALDPGAEAALDFHRPQTAVRPSPQQIEMIAAVFASISPPSRIATAR